LRVGAGEWRRATSAALLAGTTVATSLTLMGASAWLITMASFHPSIAVLQVSIVGVRACGLARGLSRYLERLLTHDVTLRLVTALRLDVFARLTTPPIGPRLRASSGDALARLTADLDTLEHTYARILGPAVTAVLVGLASILVTARLHGPAAPVVAAGFLGGGLLLPGAAWWRARGLHRALVAERAHLHRLLVDGVQGAPDLIALGADRRMAAEIAGVAGTVARTERGLAWIGAAGAVAPALAIDLATLAVAAMGAAAVATGTLAPVPYAVLVLLTATSGEAIALLPAAWQALASTAAAADRIWPEEPVPALPSPAQHQAAPSGGSQGLCLRQVGFTYPGALRPSIDGLDLDVGPGRLVAVVGDSGAGKSTLLQVVLGFWPGFRGDVWLDGRPLADWPEPARGSHLVWLAQRPQLVTGTVREIVRLGAPAASDAEIWVALDRVALSETVRAWPQGLDTWIGELGTTLSGGERQRLALARLVVANRPVLLLDEPTSQVDPPTARRLMKTLRELARTKAVLVVTHRLSELAAADEIVVLVDGQVVERGTFDGLMANAAGHFRARVLRERGEWSD